MYAHVLVDEFQVRVRVRVTSMCWWEFQVRGRLPE